MSSAVVDGVLIRVSASAVKTFERCERKWWFQYVHGIKDPPTVQQEKGTEIHSQIEHYLKTGEDVLGPFAREAKRFIPEPKSVEVEHEINLQIAGVSLLGFVDVLNTSGIWLDSEGIPHSLTEEEGEVVDWKSSGSLQYAKTPTELAVDPQMVIYGKALLLKDPKLQAVRLSHGVIGTKKREAKKVSVLVTREQIEKEWARLETVVERMMQVAAITDVEQIKPTLAACHDYNRPCVALDKCQKDPLTQLLVLTTGMGEEKMRVLTEAKIEGSINKTLSGPVPTERKMAMLDKLKVQVSPAPETPKSADPIPSVGVKSPEQAPPDPVLAVAGEEGQMHESSGQLYIWKDGRWGFAGLQSKRAWAEMQGTIPSSEPKVVSSTESKIIVEDHTRVYTQPAHDQAAAEAPKRRGRPPGSKNKEHSESAPIAVVTAAVVPPTYQDAPEPGAYREPAPAPKIEEKTTGGPQSIMLFVNCSPSIPATPLDPYINNLADHLAKAAKATSLYNSKNDQLAYGAWRGALRQAIHQHPPAPGAYVIHAKGELYDTGTEAVAEMASLVVRGPR